MPDSSSEPRPGRIDVALTMTGLLAVVGIVVPFASGEPLILTLGTELWWLAAPFLLSVPILLTDVAILARVRLPRLLRTILYGLATVSATLSIAGLIREHLPIPVVAPSCVVIGAGLLLIGGIARRVSDSPATPLIALRAAYIANAVTCLLLASWGIFDEPSGFQSWSVGAYFALVACAAYVGQTVRAFRATRRTARSMGS